MLTAKPHNSQILQSNTDNQTKEPVNKNSSTPYTNDTIHLHRTLFIFARSLLLERWPCRTSIFHLPGCRIMPSTFHLPRCLVMLPVFRSRGCCIVSQLGVFIVRFCSILGKKPTDQNNKFYFGLLQFDLIIIEKLNQTKPI